jgi:hypothetical protein
VLISSVALIEVGRAVLCNFVAMEPFQILVYSMSGEEHPFEVHADTTCAELHEIVGKELAPVNMFQLMHREIPLSKTMATLTTLNINTESVIQLCIDPRINEEEAEGWFQGLTESERAKYLKHIIYLLRTKNDSLRDDVQEFLGKQCVSELANYCYALDLMLWHKESKVRQAATVMFGLMDSNNLAEYDHTVHKIASDNDLSSRLSSRKVAVKILDKLAPQYPAKFGGVLVKLIMDENFTVRNRAAQIFDKLDPSDIAKLLPEVVEYFQPHYKAAIRGSAVKCCRMVERSELAKYAGQVAKMLDDDDSPIVLVEALKLLGQLAPNDFVTYADKVRAKRQHEHIDVRDAAAETLDIFARQL